MEKLKELANKYGSRFKQKLQEPLFFINEIIHGDEPNYKLTPYQEEWLEFLEAKKRINLMAFRSSGKSQLFFVDYPIYKAFTVAKWQGILVSNSLKQSTSLLRRVRESIMSNDILKTAVPQGREGLWSKSEGQLKNGSIIWSRPNSENLAGEHVDYVGGDEIGDWKDMDIITKTIPPMTRAKDGTIAFIGTPKTEIDPIHQLKKNKAYYSRDYTASGIHPKTGKTYWQLRYPKIDIEDAKKEYDTMSWSREFECKPLSTEDKIYPYDLVAKSFDKEAKFTEEFDQYAVYYMGLDFALSGEAGSDFTGYVVVKKKGETVRVVNMERHKGMSYQAQKARVVYLSSIYKPAQVLVDEGSFGKAFLQDLTGDHVNAVGFRFTNESKQNLHTNLRNMFEQNKMIINYDETDFKTKFEVDTLLNELDKFGVVLERGVVKLKGLGEHDDMVSALALAAWAARGSFGITWKIGRAINSQSSGIKFMGRVN